MSRAHNHTYRRPAATSTSNLPAPRDTKIEISRLDTQINHLFQNVLPKAPYLISVPSDVPYRHNSRFVNNWHAATPFTKDEEPLQYMSFSTHQDGEQSLIKAVGGWSDEKGNLVDEDPSPQQIYGSTSASPLLGGQRKKITLNDYKSKAKGEEPNKQPDMAQLDVQHSKSRDAQVNGLSRLDSKNGEIKVNSQAKKPQERKRSFDDTATVLSELKSPKPEKRARTKSPVRAKSPSSPRKNADGSQLNKSRVPSLLSPTLPPSNHLNSIPELLSPTLPSSIEDLLAQNDDEQELSSTSNHRRGDSVRSIGAVGMGNSPLSASKKVVLARTDHERHLSPSLQVDLKEARTSPGARARTSTSSPGPRQRHVIVLKYGKRNKKRVEALLRFAPRSKKQGPKAEIPRDEKHEMGRSVNGTTNSLQEASSTREKDGPTSHPSEPLLKRPKIPPSSLNLSERPTTPIPPPFKSPSTQNTLQSRSAISTPKKEFRTTAMRRVESSDGLDVRTPTSSITRQTTPSSTDKSHLPHRPSSPNDTNPHPSRPDEIRQAWIALSVKYFDLGRTLKHEAQSLLQQEHPDTKAAVLLHIEALLCFILNQTALYYASNTHTTTINNNNNSASASVSHPNWRTILPYLDLVSHHTTPYPPLSGLLAQLTAVLRQTIAKHDLDRLARDPLPDDLLLLLAAAANSANNATAANAAPTPGSDGNTKSSSSTTTAAAAAEIDIDKARRKWTAFRADLVENIREGQKAWLEGFQKLGPEVLEREFPRTWAARERDAGARAPGWERLDVLRMNVEAGEGGVFATGRYWLPLDPNSKPVEAVRVARGVVGEWAEKEREREKGRGRGWRSRIEF